MSGLDDNLLTPDELEALGVEHDRPALPSVAMDRMARRLELAMAVGGDGGNDGGGAGGGSGEGGRGPTGGASGPATGMLASAALKGGALFLAGLLAGAAGMKLMTAAPPARSGEQHGTTLSASVSSTAAPPSDAPAAVASATDVHALPDQVPPKPRAADASVVAPPSNVNLVAESQLVDGVRTALGRRDAESALELLGEHDRKYGKGALGEEADALRVRALSMAGRPEEAGARAAEFRRKYPNSLFLPTIVQPAPPSP